METDENLKKWAAIDSTTTTCIGCNEDCAKEMKSEKMTEEFCGNGGNIKINKMAESLGIGRFPFSGEAKTSSLGMFSHDKIGSWSSHGQ